MARQACAGVAHLDRSRRVACAVWQGQWKLPLRLRCRQHDAGACSTVCRSCPHRACAAFPSPSSAGWDTAHRWACLLCPAVQQDPTGHWKTLCTSVHRHRTHHRVRVRSVSEGGLTSHQLATHRRDWRRPVGGRPAPPQQQRPLPLPCRRTVREGWCVRWYAQGGAQGCAHWLRTGPEGVRAAMRQIPQSGLEASQTRLTLVLLRSLSAITIHNEVERRPVPAVYAYA